MLNSNYCFSSWLRTAVIVIQFYCINSYLHVLCHLLTEKYNCSSTVSLWLSAFMKHQIMKSCTTMTVTVSRVKNKCSSRPWTVSCVCMDCASQSKTLRHRIDSNIIYRAFGYIPALISQQYDYYTVPITSLSNIKKKLHIW